MKDLHASMMVAARHFVNQILEKAKSIETPKDFAALETLIHRQCQQLGATAYEKIAQEKIARSPAQRTCPGCGALRRHKGVRERRQVTRLGVIRVDGVYWHCPACRRGSHTAEKWFDGPWSSTVRQQAILLGTALSSFQKAKTVYREVLGLWIDEETIRKLCLHAGRQVGRKKDPLPAIQAGRPLVGSCDGTMIHTRQDGWRELKAYQYRYDDIHHGRAYLETAEHFIPRLRRAAVAIEAKKASKIFFLSDAAGWIRRGVSVQLPFAQHIIDLWHACQHLHQAANELWGSNSPVGLVWAKRHAHILRQEGAMGLIGSLKRIHYRKNSKQKTLTSLIKFFVRHASLMDYPAYEKAGWPISSGPMESFCKQLGTRLKGPGMRWSVTNVNPMAALVSLWANDEWDRYWKNTA